MKNILIRDLNMYKLKVQADVSWLFLLKHILYCLIYFPGFACVFMFRVNNFLYRKNIFGYKLMGVLRHYIFSNDISFKINVGPGFRIVHVTDIVIGSNAIIGSNVTILNGVSIGSSGSGDNKMPKIGSNVFIGTGSKLIGDIKIGDNSFIGALCFCNKSVPASSLAVGNPVIIKNNYKI